MKQTITKHDFIKAFRDIRPDNFSYEGLDALYNYLIDLEEDMEQEFELDVVALCCDYTEYKDLKELQQEYDDIETMEDLQGETIVIEIPDSDGFIIQDY